MSEPHYPQSPEQEYEYEANSPYPRFRIDDQMPEGVAAMVGADGALTVITNIGEDAT